MTTPDDLAVLREKNFADAITKLEELLLQCGRVFLIGAGCSKCAGLPLTAELAEEQATSVRRRPRASCQAPRDWRAPRELLRPGWPLLLGALYFAVTYAGSSVG